MWTLLSKRSKWTNCNHADSAGSYLSTPRLETKNHRLQDGNKFFERCFDRFDGYHEPTRRLCGIGRAADRPCAKVSHRGRFPLIPGRRKPRSFEAHSSRYFGSQPMEDQPGGLFEFPQLVSQRKKSPKDQIFSLQRKPGIL